MIGFATNGLPSGKMVFYLALLFYSCALLSIASYLREIGATVPLSFWGQKEIFLALGVGIALLGFLGAYIFLLISFVCHALWCLISFPFLVKRRKTFQEYLFELGFVSVRYLFLFASWPIANDMNCFLAGGEPFVHAFFLLFVIVSMMSIIFAETKLVRADELDPDEGLGRFYKTQAIIIGKLMIFGLLVFVGYELDQAQKDLFCKVPPTIGAPLLFFGVCWTGSFLYKRKAEKAPPF